MARNRQQKREYQTEYRERQQLKVAREVIAGKRNGNGKLIKVDTTMQHADLLPNLWIGGCRCELCNSRRAAAAAEVAE